jgi:hypothetical protein
VSDRVLDFACYNCRNTVPSLKKWTRSIVTKANDHRRAHSESDLESNVDEVRRQVAGWASSTLSLRQRLLNLESVQRRSLASLSSYRQTRTRALDARREGYYDQTEEVIKKLLAEEEAALKS